MTETIDHQECWDFFDTAYNDLNKSDNNNITNNENDNESEIKCKKLDNKCISCGHIEYININVCTNCGLTFSDDITYDDFDSSNIIGNGDNTDVTVTSYFKKNVGYSKISQMQNWYMWSNDEKNLYKLSLYTKNICSKLNITLYIEYICNLVKTVLYKLKDQDGSKRTRVKDGIIIVCIYYVYKKYNVFVNSEFSTMYLSKLIKLDIKYITKAEKSVVELINKNKIDLDKSVFFNINTPISYIKNNGVSLNLDKKLLENIYVKAERLINLCEKEDLLLDHTPLSIGIGCFYFVLKHHDIGVEIDMVHFSKIYKLSSVTILKLYKKLIYFFVKNPHHLNYIKGL
jgi:transcription initiation factor TFIIIB Brf1 subunit/transcription initiation factor TFIIB